mmetsp:Transcript_34656/g.98191  ORF Transcript_34656/g.98191 Transcript_34656/m.98191 type:complete len:198 (+) Transcript_34656:272-865(+)
MAWEKEYWAVRCGYEALEGRVEDVPDLGLAIVRPPEPLHYYSTFSRTKSSDILVTIYPGGRYEVEAKYTQYVSFHSRPVWPRLDFGPLAKVLNELEGTYCSRPGLIWGSDRLVYTGPLLRLDRSGQKLSTVQKYGHATDRPIYASGIPEEVFVNTVLSFMRFGLGGLEPKCGGWSWEELQAVNQGIGWEEWKASLKS